MSIPTTIFKYWAMNSNYIVKIKELLFNFPFVIINSADGVCRICEYHSENNLLKIATKYMSYLPTEEVLIAEIEHEKLLIKQQFENGTIGYLVLFQ